jgi:molybdopterin synthase catalytic subunit
MITPPVAGDTWIGLGAEPIPVGAIYDWCVSDACGAVVLFSGTVRDHAEGRTGVTHLDYEAYEDQALVRMTQIDAEIRRRWTEIGRVVLLHRVGRLMLGESSVVVAVSAAHRGEAFDGARFGIDTIKTAVPIWKRESWETGARWSPAAHVIDAVGEL